MRSIWFTVLMISLISYTERDCLKNSAQKLHRMDFEDYVEEVVLLNSSHVRNGSEYYYHDLANYDYVIDEGDSHLSTFQLVFLYCYYFIVSTIGVVGNILVIRTIFNKPQMRTMINVVLLNQAIADILSSTVATVNELMENSFNFIFHLTYFCNIGHYLISVKYFIQLLVFSIATIKMFTKLPNISISTGTTVKSSIAVWIFGAVVQVNQAFLVKAYEINEKHRCFVEESLSTASYFIRHFCYTAIWLIFPFVFVICLISHKVFRGSYYNRGSTNDLLFLMMLVQVILITPATTARILLYEDFSHFMIGVTCMINFLNVAYKPILYFIISDDFRSEFIRLLSLRKKSNEILSLRIHEEL